MNKASENSVVDASGSVVCEAAPAPAPCDCEPATSGSVGASVGLPIRLAVVAAFEVSCEGGKYEYPVAGVQCVMFFDISAICSMRVATVSNRLCTTSSKLGAMRTFVPCVYQLPSTNMPISLLPSSFVISALCCRWSSHGWPSPCPSPAMTYCIPLGVSLIRWFHSFGSFIIVWALAGSWRLRLVKMAMLIQSSGSNHGDEVK